MQIDLENGIITVAKAGETNSGNTSGFADGFIVDSDSSGERTFALFGNNSDQYAAGLFCLSSNNNLYNGIAYLTRLSLNGVG